MKNIVQNMRIDFYNYHVNKKQNDISLEFFYHIYCISIAINNNV